MDRRLFITSLAAIPAGLMTFGVKGALAANHDGSGEEGAVPPDGGEGTGETTGDVKVFGYVVNKDTGAPVPNWMVIVSGGQSVETNEEGFYMTTTSAAKKIKVKVKGDRTRNFRGGSDTIIAVFYVKVKKEKGGKGGGGEGSGTVTGGKGGGGKGGGGKEGGGKEGGGGKGGGGEGGGV